MLKLITTPLRALLRHRVVEAELDEELCFHLERETLRNLENGMPAEAAPRAALQSFGGGRPMPLVWAKRSSGSRPPSASSISTAAATPSE